MSDISTALDPTLTKLQNNVAGFKNTVGLETAGTAQAAAKVAAASKALAQAQALVTKTQTADKTADAKQALIDAASTAWTTLDKTIQGATALSPKVLREQLALGFPETDGVAADSLDGLVLGPISALDADNKKIGGPEKTALDTSNDALKKSQDDLATATTTLDGKIQALQAVSADRADAQKKMADNYAAGLKLAQAADKTSLYLGLVKYADFITNEGKVGDAPAAYEAALADATQALSDWQAKVAAEADAETDVITKQLAYDQASATLAAALQTRDQNAQGRVQDALQASASKAAPKATAPAPAPAPAKPKT